MTSIDDQMVEVYVFVSDYMTRHPQATQWRTSPNNHPAFTAEVITLALLQGCFGCATLKRLHQIAVASPHLRSAFPRLCSYKQFVARLHSLSSVVGQLIQASLLPGGERAYIVDGKPIPVCKPIRHGHVRLLRDEGAYFSKSTTGWYFGFKLHALVHARTRQIVSAVLTPATTSEHDASRVLADSLSYGGVLLGDLGYRSKRQELDNWLREECGLTLVTPAHAKQAGGSAAKHLVGSVRQGIEATFSSLWSGFVDRVYSRSWQGLWSTIKVKLLHYNLQRAGVITFA